MAEILIVSATLEEVAFLRDLALKGNGKNFFSLRGSARHKVDVLVTGPGIAFTTYHLSKALQAKKYDLAINLGICGSLDPSIKPVRLVNINADSFGDFGAEDGNEFLDIFEMGLLKPNREPFKSGKVRRTFNYKLSCLSAIPSREAITVQKVHGSSTSARRAFEKYGPVMESMEGAAFFFVCNHEKIPCLQVRAVSNKVERRNKSKWKIREAISSLEGFTGLLLLELENSL